MKLGVLGLGNMGGAILNSILSKKAIREQEILIYDILEDLMEGFQSKFNEIHKAKNEIDLMKKADIILFAVKPQYLPEILKKIKNNLEKLELTNKTIISIAAGVKIEFYEKYLGENISIIRVMPNILALVDASASALTFNKKVSKQGKDFALNLFENMGTAIVVKEELIDVVTGLSGSGPAFVAIFIESLSDGAVKMGLPRKESYLLAAQTVLGVGKMILEKELNPAILKDMVSSPGGTTITGIHELEKNNFRNSIMSAVIAATEKSRELGKKSN